MSTPVSQLKNQGASPQQVPPVNNDQDVQDIIRAMHQEGTQPTQVTTTRVATFEQPPHTQQQYPQQMMHQPNPYFPQMQMHMGMQQ